MWISTDEPKWKKKFLKWAEEYPDEVTVKRKAEDNDGCLYLTCPASWLRIRPPKKRNLTDEQRAEIAERLHGARNNNDDEEPEDEE